MEKTLNRNGDGKSDSMHSFSEALTAAKENIGPTIKSALTDSAEQISTLAEEAKRQVLAKSRDASRAVNQHVHSQPWGYVAGASIIGLALGFYLARRK